MIFNVSLFLDEILLNMIEIGGDAEEGGHQVQGEGNPKNTKKTPTTQYKKVGKREDSDIPGSASPRWFEIYIIKTFCFIKCSN